jgi:hypothetical protein
MHAGTVDGAKNIRLDFVELSFRIGARSKSTPSMIPSLSAGEDTILA